MLGVCKLWCDQPRHCSIRTEYLTQVFLQVIFYQNDWYSIAWYMHVLFVFCCKISQKHKTPKGLCDGPTSSTMMVIIRQFKLITNIVWIMMISLGLLNWIPPLFSLLHLRELVKQCITFICHSYLTDIPAAELTVPETRHFKARRWQWLFRLQNFKKIWIFKEFLLHYTHPVILIHYNDVIMSVRGIHRWPVNSSHKRPVTRKLFPFDDVIMKIPALAYIMAQYLSGDKASCEPMMIQFTHVRGTMSKWVNECDVMLSTRRRLAFWERLQLLWIFSVKCFISYSNATFLSTLLQLDTVCMTE